MWTLSATLLLLLLLNSATLINLKERDNSEKESEADVHHRLDKKNPHKISHLHCTKGKLTFELVMDEAGSRSRARIPKKERPQQDLKSPFEKDEIVSGDEMKKWYKRMGLY